MLSFKTFVLESEAEEKTHSLFHTSPKPIGKVGDSPMWFAHTREHADAYHQNSLDNHGSAHTYSAEVRGNIAHHEDPKVRKVLSDAGVDHEDYSNDLVSNPTKEEVEDHPGTHALKAAGYHGYTHSDYDPIDPDKDTDTTVVFNPSKRVSLEPMVPGQQNRNRLKVENEEYKNEVIQEVLKSFREKRFERFGSSGDLIGSPVRIVPRNSGDLIGSPGRNLGIPFPELDRASGNSELPRNKKVVPLPDGGGTLRRPRPKD